MLRLIIRVINRRQTIRNNYIEGVKGYRFGGALVVMNGVPNSPINRYDGVEDSVIAANSLIDSDHIQLAAGSDAERSAVPIRTSFDRNLIVQSKRTSDVFTVYDDISGISFRENVISGSDAPVRQGFSPEAVRLFTAENGLKYSTADDHENIGVRRDIKVVEKSSTGVDWYRKPEKSARFDSGSLVRVTPGKDTLFQGIKKAGTGGIVELAPGDYEVGKTIALEHAVTVRSQGLATITFERSALFEIKDGGSLKLRCRGNQSACPPHGKITDDAVIQLVIDAAGAWRTAFLGGDHAGGHAWPDWIARWWIWAWLFRGEYGWQSYPTFAGCRDAAGQK